MKVVFTGVLCVLWCSLKSRKIRRKTPVPVSPFNKVAGLLQPATIKREIGEFLKKKFKTASLEKTYGRRLLELLVFIETFEFSVNPCCRSKA